ncbi:hypothetical protein CIPAW_03G144300 [Carya illinoinensis]|uniref:Uncharacterized protein n=1 Tax=Carya illinoinensis TaxID=32201 RepID=A0A8T1R396_CARIL|nr:hypothetical protein CIPAW_03G144300 [Carya illinoinensis]
MPKSCLHSSNELKAVLWCLEVEASILHHIPSSIPAFQWKRSNIYIELSVSCHFPYFTFSFLSFFFLLFFFFFPLPFHMFFYLFFLFSFLFSEFFEIFFLNFFFFSFFFFEFYFLL